MVCYRVLIPEGVKVEGLTADGRPTAVLPGEYLVNLLPPKVPAVRPVVRFVGADATCRDVHVPLDIARRYLAASANDASTRTQARAA